MIRTRGDILDYTYLRNIYNWLTDTLGPWLVAHDADIASILSTTSDILDFVRNLLYLAVFGFLFWVAKTWLQSHLLKV